MTGPSQGLQEARVAAAEKVVAEEDALAGHGGETKPSAQQRRHRNQRRNRKQPPLDCKTNDEPEPGGSDSSHRLMPQELQSTGREDGSQPSARPQPSAQQRRHTIIQQRRNRSQTAPDRRTSDLDPIALAEPASGVSDSNALMSQELQRAQRQDESKPSAPPNDRAVENVSALQQKLIEQEAEHSQDRRRWEDEISKLRSQVGHLEAAEVAAETSMQTTLENAQRDLSAARKEIEQLRAELLEPLEQAERHAAKMAGSEQERRAETAQEPRRRDAAMCTAGETERQRDRERQDLEDRLVAALADAARMEAELGALRGRYTAEVLSAERVKSELQAAATAAQKADQQYVACVDACLRFIFWDHSWCLD